MSTFNTIHIGGEYIIEPAYTCGATPITPGMVVETFDDNGITKWRPHSTADGIQSRAVAVEQMGRGVDETYAADDLVIVHIYHTGGMFWGLLPSGQDIATAQGLQSNGDGMLKASTATTAAANVVPYKSKEDTGAVTETTRIWVEVI